jgi:hypothetical protein
MCFALAEGILKPIGSKKEYQVKKGSRAVIMCMCQRPVSLNFPISLLVVLRTDSGLSLEDPHCCGRSQRGDLSQ